MKTLLVPATKLMAQLRLLPKFLLVSLLFILPLALVTGLLFAELQKSIAAARQEQQGLHYVTEVQDLNLLLQQQRALRHMLLNGNAKMAEPAKQMQVAINSKLTALAGGNALLAKVGLQESLAGVSKTWQGLVQQQQTALKARDSYAGYTALIGQVQRLATQLADRTKLRLDPEAATHYLALTILDNIPAVSDNVLGMSGRGAAYIDTGLLEASEDLMLAATVTSGKTQLNQLGEKLNALFYDTPAWKASLSPQLPALPLTLAFFDRATNEVLKSVDQTSGEQFFKAGQQSVQGLQALSAAATGLLDAQLAARIGQYELRRNLIMAGVLAVLLLAAYLLAGFYISFKAEIDFLSRAVEGAAAGDLRLQSVSHGKDEISGLVGAFSGMNVSLSQLISNVRHSAGIITAASGEIANGNNELSGRTESQASSLQQTAALMETLTEAVKKNAADAAHANQLALAASGFAVRGGQAVGEVVQTMESIRQSSDKIGGIIGVIDGIAFQTNILALNAAVEAARAGEQGRGFAVVASEVRTLAQRSAAAAKEIKTLIDASVSNVQTGGQQVKGAGTTMNDIVTSINEVVQIMHAITASSQNQSTGIAEVSNAMAHIDSMTQQNAALVEEAAAAAESLQEQADLLAQAVSVFKLDQANEDSSAFQIGHAAGQRPAMTHQAPLLTRTKVAALPDPAQRNARAALAAPATAAGKSPDKLRRIA